MIGYSMVFQQAFLNPFLASGVASKIDLWGNAEVGTSLVLKEGDFSTPYKWKINGQDAFEPAGTINYCKFSNNPLGAAWVLKNSSSVAITPNILGYIPSADKKRFVPLIEMFNYFYEQVVAVPTAGTYTMSFLYRGNREQTILVRTPGTTDKVAINCKPYWQRCVLTGTLASAGNISFRIDTRTASVSSGGRLPVAGNGVAIDDMMISLAREPSGIIETGNAISAARPANVPASGQSFYIKVSDSGKSIACVLNNGVSKSVTYSDPDYGIAIGQSNEVGQGLFYDPVTQYVSPRVKVWGRRVDDWSGVANAGKVMYYADPSQWNEALTGSTNSPNGMANDDCSSFGTLLDLIANHFNKDIIGLPEARSGSSFNGIIGNLSENWQAPNGTYPSGGTLFQAAYNRLTGAGSFLAKYSNARCRVIDISLQESDIGVISGAGMAWNTFKNHMIALVNAFRAVVGSTVPVVFLGTCPSWTSANTALILEYAAGFRELNGSTPWLSLARYVDTDPVFNGGITYLGNNSVVGSSDGTHFCAIELKTRIPQKKFELLKTLW